MITRHILFAMAMSAVAVLSACQNHREGIARPSVAQESSARTVSAAELAKALFPDDSNGSKPSGVQRLQDVREIGSEQTPAGSVRVLFVRRVITGMQAERGMSSVEIIGPGVCRIASIDVSPTTAVALEDGLLRVGSLPPIPIGGGENERGSTSWHTTSHAAADLLAKGDAAEWSRQAVTAALDTYRDRGIMPLTVEPLPQLLRAASGSYWYGGLHDLTIVDGAARQLAEDQGRTLPVRITGYRILEMLATDIAAPALRYSAYWEATVRAEVWPSEGQAKPLRIEFAVLGDSDDRDRIASVRLLRVLPAK